MRVPAITADTASTRHEGIAHDFCAYLPVAYIGPRFGNRSAKFMSHHQWRWAAGAIVFVGLQLAAADTSGRDLDLNLIGLRGDIIDVANFHLFKGRIMQCAHA